MPGAPARSASLLVARPIQRHCCWRQTGPGATQELTQHVLSAGRADDDLRAHGSHAHFNTGVAILGKLTSQQLVELGVEHAVCDELQAAQGTAGASSPLKHYIYDPGSRAMHHTRPSPAPHARRASGDSLRLPPCASC